MPTDVDVRSHGTRLAAWHVPATCEDWTTPAGRPLVVMAHGFGCTKDSGLLPFAERFAAAGADVLLFDYRGFADSDGAQRQVVDHRRHREDYHAAIAHARSMPGIDPDRIVVWGSSYSGGHVVVVAADDPRVAGVISQGAAMDGLLAVLEILRYAGPRQLLRLSLHAVRGAVGERLGRAPRLIPIVGPPGSLAAITSHDGESGYGSIAGASFRNEMRVSGILPIMRNRPVRAAPRLQAPLFLVVATRDTIAPPAAVEKVAARAAGRVVVERYDVGHFDIYLGEPFEKSVAAQVDFLASVVGR
ncbi:MAG: alpha/beta fold hydrolase [Actinobacteria bacterium]|uniref:Unannotated protein n=1 Tax=freshwater metagenome TaxID=449393 RepID=A0A6J6R3U8_9ZZZZ|nr:alpha/beta fold hydrolase [Actinomycetota bacterium]